jgi:hypothetical protein
MKILSVGVELFYGDGKTDMTKLIVALRNAANTLKNYQLYGVKKKLQACLGANENELYL